jgi:zinc protease
MHGRTAVVMFSIVACAAAGRGGGGGTPSGRAAGAGPGPAAPQEIARANLGALTASKWRLGNGLEVVLLPDPSATAVAYMTWFRIGSRHEDDAEGETGLAHLFEHLMFTQTKGHPDGAFDRAVEEVGGSANAMTYYDFTAYTNDVPPDALPLIVELEADRMVNLDLRGKQVENEREVVVEERLSSVEDNVDGTMDERLYEQAFSKHPYRWPVIGRMKDIKAITRDKAVAFYERYYAPSNAVIVIAGKIDAAAALDMVNRAYGPLPAANKPPRDDAQPERAPAKVVRTTVLQPVPADRLAIGWPAPGLGDADRAAYEIAAEMLTGGPSSRLARGLIADRAWASSVIGEVAPTRDPGLYEIAIQLVKGHGAEDAEKLVVDAAADLAARAPTAAELASAVARLETAFWRALESSHGRAEALGQYEVATGDFRRLFARADDYTRVGAEDVRAVAHKYFGSGARSVVVARNTPPRDPERVP